MLFKQLAVTAALLFLFLNINQCLSEGWLKSVFDWWRLLSSVSTPFGYLLESGVLKSFSFDVVGSVVLLERDTVLDLSSGDSHIGRGGCLSFFFLVWYHYPLIIYWCTFDHHDIRYLRLRQPQPGVLIRQVYRGRPYHWYAFHHIHLLYSEQKCRRGGIFRASGQFPCSCNWERRLRGCCAIAVGTICFPFFNDILPMKWNVFLLLSYFQFPLVFAGKQFGYQIGVSSTGLPPHSCGRHNHSPLLPFQVLLLIQCFHDSCGFGY